MLFIIYGFVGGYWKEKENMRVMCDKYAKDMGFDPLVPTNWHQHMNHKDKKRSHSRLKVGIKYQFNTIIHC